MAASFPANVPSFPVLVDDQDDILAAHQNSPNDEITAIGTAVGPNGLGQSYAADLLSFLMGRRTTIQLAYSSASTIVAKAGTVLITDSGASQRLMRRNTVDTNVTGANLDTGGPALATSTRYYVYADGDSASTASAFVLSTNGTSPSGKTRYFLLGRFDTDGSGNIIENSVLSTAIYDQAKVGSIVQRKRVELTAFSTTTAQIPFDDTKPQKTEGELILELAMYAHATTSLMAMIVVFNGQLGTDDYVTTAVFWDAGTGTIVSDCIVAEYARGQHQPTTCFPYQIVAGSLNKLQFNVRVGGASGTLGINGFNSGRKLGGAIVSSIEIVEFKA